MVSSKVLAFFTARHGNQCRVSSQLAHLRDRLQAGYPAEVEPHPRRAFIASAPSTSD